jgi:serine/threonine protein kinase
MIEVPCPHCALSILVPPTVRGRQGVCFGCGRPLQVPREPSESAKSLAFEHGQRVSDRYVIDTPLGKGGMGVVYKAEDTLVRETVALKFMRPQLLQTEKGQQLFIHEAQVARRLRHENIVAVHDVSWTHDGILYLSLEFAQGQSLRQFLRKHRTERKLIDVRMAVRLIRQMLSALDFAHRTVVHRDIKPENVMLQPGEIVKVLDFGLAKAVHDEMAQDESGAKSKSMVGTLAYAAPEQIRRHDVDHRADIYAVGLVFYELLTLRTPVDETVPVKNVRKDVSPSLLDVLHKALREERDQRWPTAMAFQEALEHAFDSSYNRSVERIEIQGRSEAVSTEEMIYQEGGHFLMGGNAVQHEAPEREEVAAPFWIDAHPVTNGEYAAFLEATGLAAPKYAIDDLYNGPDQPVVGVNWNEARAYAEWAGKQLPTEVQWEYAARGKENRLYPWGNAQPDTTRCNFQDYLGMPSMISMHEEGATPEGVCDMAGNVYEWSIDDFAPSESPDAVLRKTVRGGCWSSHASKLRCTTRHGLFPETKTNTVGFRCVVLAEKV